MYGYEWTDENGIYQLTIRDQVKKEIRPVFQEELDYFGMGAYWQYPETRAPLLWAEGIRRYVHNGVCVAEAKGGGFYTRPTIELRQRELQLHPVDVERLWTVNQALMLGLEQKAIAFIRETHRRFKRRGYAFVVAFSGGKDSLVLLDLVSKALPPDEFMVIFSNTGMELQVTLDAVQAARQRWGALKFYEASSHLSPQDSWDAFGPPGRRMRWCCAVHKSVPTVLRLREIIGDPAAKVVVFDGVRAEESSQRADYDEISIGAKNINQVNCSPILEWGTAEVYLYLLKNDILLNKAYRQGLFRVGCMVCPMSSTWWESLSSDIYAKEVLPFYSRIQQYAVQTKPKQERKKFIQSGGWKARMGGRGLPNGGNRVSERIEDNSIRFDFLTQTQDWLSVAPLLGPILDHSEKGYTQRIDGREFVFSVDVDAEHGLSVRYAPYDQMSRFTISHLRGVANKVAYCIGCKACVVQCPTNAFVITDEGKIYIRTDRCIHCANCIEHTNGKGCLVAKSLSTTGGNGMDLKGMNRYQHFGLRKQWLEHFFHYKSDCFTMNQLGNRQYDALRVWLREAGLLSAANKGERAGLPTPLFEKLEKFGPLHPLTWAVIWANLAYHSTIVRWYMLFVPNGEVYEKNDLVTMLGDGHSQATRDNAVTALLETLRHSPIGSVLKQGIPLGSGNNFRYAKDGWETPDALAILYALYLWAEATGRYTFTLSQMQEARGNPDALGMDPVSIYGLNPTAFRDILQDLALNLPQQIRVTFVKDLDTVHLDPNLKSLDILDLAH